MGPLLELINRYLLILIVLSAFQTLAQPLRLGYGEFPPYNFTDQNGDPAGFQVEVLTRAASRAKVKISWVQNPDLGISCLDQNLCDVWIQAIIPNSKHPRLRFTKAWWGMQKGFITTHPDTLRSVSDLNGRRVAYLGGKGIFEEARSAVPASLLNPFPTRDEAVDQLCLGNAEAIFDSTAALISMSMSRRPDCEHVRFGLISVRNNTSFGLASLPASSAQMNKLRDQIELMSLDGSLLQISSHYELFADISSYLAESQTARQLQTQRIYFFATSISFALISCAFIVIRLKTTNSSLKVALAQAAASNLAKKDFLATISHELKTPLTGVKGMVELALAEPRRPIRENYLNQSVKSADSLLTVLNDILDFARVGAGNLVLKPVPLSLHQLCDQLRPLFESSAQAKHLGFEIQQDPELPEWILADPVRLRQILVNLLGNAFKFTEHGTVRLQITQPQPNLLRFAVIDTGIGISKQKLSTIFEAFQQGDSSDTRKHGGTGLGLTIAKQLVNLMDSHLFVKSTLGKGSEFSFSLQILPCDPPIQPPPPPAKSARDLNLSILLVEDNPTNQFLIKSLLVKKHCTVSIASNGIDAIRLAERQQFDLILMDVQMPEMNGIETASRIRSLGIRKIPIIGITAHAGEEDKASCIEAGMSQVMSKPIDATILFKVISDLVPQSSTY